jgi:multidrug transporter EmrE-like cation transporter
VRHRPADHRGERREQHLAAGPGAVGRAVAGGDHADDDRDGQRDHQNVDHRRLPWVVRARYGPAIPVSAGSELDSRDMSENTALRTDQRSQRRSTMWQWAWATVAFLSELAALAALALAGFTVPSGIAARVLLGVGLPLAAAVLWGLFAAPHAPVQLGALAVATKVLVYGAAVGALLVAGHPWPAAVLAAAALLGSLLSPSPEDLSRPVLA